MDTFNDGFDYDAYRDAKMKRSAEEGITLSEKETGSIDALGEEIGIENLSEIFKRAVDTDKGQTVALLKDAETQEPVERLTLFGSKLLTQDLSMRHLILKFEFNRYNPRTDKNPVFTASFMKTTFLEKGNDTKRVGKLGQFATYFQNTVDGKTIVPDSGLKEVKNLINAIEIQGETVTLGRKTDLKK